MPQQPFLLYKIFDVWGIDFTGPFPSLMAIATKTNDAKVVVDFLKSNIFCQFGVLKALINDQGSHLCNRAMSSLLHKYGIMHRVAMAYHPRQTAKLKCSTRKSRKHSGRTRADSLRTLYGHIELHIGHRWECPLRDCLRKGSSYCKNWTNTTWKLMRTLGSINRKSSNGQRILLFNSNLKLIAGMVSSKWDGPFVITHVFPYGVMELMDENTNNTFMVNGH
ncbi:hypothetical protein CR513_15835, partial [Mucuna pruriens]